jgi:hypothetical protein
MARSAGKGAIAFQKAGGFKQSVPSVGDLEPVRVAGLLRLVKVKDVIAEQLSRAIGKIAAAITPDRIRQPMAGGFQMTLQAHFELSFRAEARRIHNGSSNVFERLSGMGSLNMLAPRSVAALAINSLGNSAREREFALAGSRFGLYCRVRVVAEKAFPINLTTEVHVIRPVISRIHSPEAAPFGIPSDRQL